MRLQKEAPARLCKHGVFGIAGPIGPLGMRVNRVGATSFWEPNDDTMSQSQIDIFWYHSPSESEKHCANQRWSGSVRLFWNWYLRRMIIYSPNASYGDWSFCQLSFHMFLTNLNGLFFWENLHRNHGFTQKNGGKKVCFLRVSLPIQGIPPS